MIDTGCKVVWAEGILLGPQHFQQWEQRYEQLALMHHQYLHEGRYGIWELEIDEMQLALGQFQINKLVALLPDGQWVTYNHNQSTQTLTLPLTNEVNSVYLAVPRSYNKITGITGYPAPDSDQLAWGAYYQRCLDLYDGTKEREVLFAKQRLMLTTDLASLPVSTTLKLAELSALSPPAFALKSYIPPSLTLRSAPWLVAKLQTLISQIMLGMTRLRDQLQGRADNMQQDVIGDPIRRLLLSVLARYYAQFNGLVKALDRAPESLYGSLCEFACELIAFTKISLPDYPAFNRECIYEQFYRLFDELLYALTEAMPAEHKVLQLQKYAPNYYGLKQLSLSRLENSHLYLEVHCSLNNDDWLNAFLKKIKIGAPSKIEDIYAQAVTGVNLKHILRYPTQLIAKANHEYFQLLCQGPFWQQILEEKGLAVLLPKELEIISMGLVLLEKE